MTSDREGAALIEKWATSAIQIATPGVAIVFFLNCYAEVLVVEASGSRAGSVAGSPVCSRSGSRRRKSETPGIAFRWIVDMLALA